MQSFALLSRAAMKAKSVPVDFEAGDQICKEDQTWGDHDVLLNSVTLRNGLNN